MKRKPARSKSRHTTATAPAPHRSLAPWLAFALAFVTFVAYARVPTNDFTWWDDQQTLHGNRDFNPPTLTGLARYWTEPEAGLYAPLTYTLWGLLSFLAHGNRIYPSGSSLNPAVFHAASVLVHIATAIFVMALLRRLLRTRDDTDDQNRARTDWAAFAGAALYALHPVQTESVAWASGMKDLLFGFFSVLALWQYSKWAQRSTTEQQGRSSPRPYVIALVAAALGMLSKPTAVVIPLAIFVIDHFLIRRPLKKIILSILPFLAMAAITAIIARAAQPASHVQPSPIWTRPLIVADSLAFYTYKLIFPLNLAVDYGRRPSALSSTWHPYVTWIVPTAIFIVVSLKRRTAPHLLAAALLFVIGALPVLGLLPFEFQGYSTVADHYLYLSLLGPALALAWAASRYPSPRLATICTIILALFWLRTMLQTRHWRDDESLWTHNLRVNPRSFLAHTNLGYCHELHGRPHLAIDHYRQAAQLTDDYVNATAMHNLANNLLRAGKYDEAITWYEKFIAAALTVPPEARAAVSLDLAYLNLGRALSKVGRTDQARVAFTKALELNPEQKQAAEALKGL